MWQLIILLTTCNFPDVMMDLYGENRASCLFFMIFLVATVFFSLPILLAVVYSSYVEAREKESGRREMVKKIFLTRAFNTLLGYYDMVNYDDEFGDDDDLYHPFLTPTNPPPNSSIQDQEEEEEERERKEGGQTSNNHMRNESKRDDLDKDMVISLIKEVKTFHSTSITISSRQQNQEKEEEKEEGKVDEDMEIDHLFHDLDEDDV